MRIGAYEVPQEVVRDVSLAIRAREVPFGVADVLQWLKWAGVPDDQPQRVASEAANRLLQAERRAGHVRFTDGKWHAVRGQA